VRLDPIRTKYGTEGMRGLAKGEFAVQSGEEAPRKG